MYLKGKDIASKWSKYNEKIKLTSYRLVQNKFIDVCTFNIASSKRRLNKDDTLHAFPIM